MSRRAAAVAVAAASAFALGAGSASSAPTPAAARFWSAARTFELAEAYAADAATWREARALKTCDVLPRNRSASFNRRAGVIDIAWREVILMQSLNPPYRRLVRAFGRVRTSSTALRTIRSSTLLVSAQLRKLDGVDANVCTYLAHWRDTGWSTDYEGKIRDPFYEIFGLDHAVVGRAARRAANTIPALQRLGLTFDHALKLASVDSILGF